MVREPAIVTEERVEATILAQPFQVAQPDQDGPATDDLVQTDLLIEDVSIDGMCGVY